MKYLWAAYRKGALDEFHPAFSENLDAREFREVFAVILMENGWNDWILLTETKRGFEPIGFITAWPRGRIIEIADMVWFPWASKRNIWESAFNFFDSMRKKVADEASDPKDPMRYFVVFEYARYRDKKFFERMVNKGVLKRVGHINDLYPAEPAVMFQTKSPVGRG